jgi:hypothetical protein
VLLDLRDRIRAGERLDEFEPLTAIGALATGRA